MCFFCFDKSKCPPWKGSLVVEISRSGPKWWTDWPTQRHSTGMPGNAWPHLLLYPAPVQTHLLKTDIWMCTSPHLKPSRVHSLCHYSTFPITFITLHHVHFGPFAFGPFSLSFILAFSLSWASFWQRSFTLTMVKWWERGMNMNKKGIVWKREMWNREMEGILLMYKDEGWAEGSVRSQLRSPQIMSILPLLPISSGLCCLFAAFMFNCNDAEQECPHF